VIEVHWLTLIAIGVGAFTVGGIAGFLWWCQIQTPSNPGPDPNWPRDPTEEIAALKRTTKAAAEANDVDHVRELQNALAELQKLAALRTRVQRERENGFTRR
jgi:uncharacterized membrane protein